MNGGAVVLAVVTGVTLAAAGVVAVERRAEGEPAPAERVAAPAGVERVREMVVVADDFSFEAPASVPAGRTSIRMVNRGAEVHHVQVVRLEEGRTLEGLLEAIGPHGALPAWAREVGGPNVALPGGGQFSAVVTLKEGEYALLCVIPSPDGVIHVMKGMSRSLTVTEPVPAGPESGDAAGEPDLVLTLNDYAFAFSEALTPGTHTLRVRTVGRQSHEFVLFRLEEGRTAADIVQWFGEGQQGPPPALPVGGVVGLAPGEENDIELTLEKGRYAFLCFLPDATDGAPHFVHGMMQDYEVR